MRLTGTLKFFKPVQGYGFLARDDGGRDVFVHTEQLKSSRVLWVATGARFEFEVVDDNGKGPRAVELKPLDGAEQRPS